MESAGFASLLSVGYCNQGFYLLHLLPYLCDFKSLSQVWEFLRLFLFVYHPLRSLSLRFMFSDQCCWMWLFTWSCKILRGDFFFLQLLWFPFYVEHLSMLQSSLGVISVALPCTGWRVMNLSNDMCSWLTLLVSIYLIAIFVCRIWFFLFRYSYCPFSNSSLNTL